MHIAGDQRITRPVAERLAIDSDPAWIRWWSGAPVAALELFPAPDGEVSHVTVRREPDVLHVWGCSSTLHAYAAQAGTRDEAEQLLGEGPARCLFLDLVQDMLVRAGNHLDIGAPPPLPNAKFPLI